MQSTPLIAFDQHAATTIAAVLLPGDRTPALHTLSSDSATILRFVRRLTRQVGAGAGPVLLRGRAVWLRVATGLGRAGHPV